MSNEKVMEHILNVLPESYKYFVSSIGLRD